MTYSPPSLSVSGVAVLRAAAEQFAVSGPAIYAIGWFFYTILYGRLGFSGEEVGLGFAELVVRVALLGLLVAVPVLAGVVVWRGKVPLADLLLQEKLSVQRRVLFQVLAAISFGLGILTALLLSILLSEIPSIWRLLLAVLGLAVSFSLSILVLGWVLKVDENPGEHTTKVESVRALSITIAIGALLSFGLAYVSANQLASRVSDGQNITIPGLRLPLVDVYGVEQTWTPESDASRLKQTEMPLLSCVTLVGGNDGVQFIFDSASRSAWRLSAETVVVKGPAECLKDKM